MCLLVNNWILTIARKRQPCLLQGWMMGFLILQVDDRIRYLCQYIQCSFSTMTFSIGYDLSKQKISTKRLFEYCVHDHWTTHLLCNYKIQFIILVESWMCHMLLHASGRRKTMPTVPLNLCMHAPTTQHGTLWILTTRKKAWYGTVRIKPTSTQSKEKNKGWIWGAHQTKNKTAKTIHSNLPHACISLWGVGSADNDTCLQSDIV